ncbi:aspartic peptidase domain-containing protein [Cyathus striatus]|nr:aspartic peptidase domain-containing protein [Cyathus striatus]
MNPSFLLFIALAALSSPAVAHKFTIKQIKNQSLQRRGLSPSDLQLNVLATADTDAPDLETVHDLIYMANITIAGVEYPVQLDTGSSDLWIKGDQHPTPNTNQTDMTYNLTYAIGWAYGNVAYAPVEFIGLSVPSQAFLDVSDVVNPALQYGAKGIVGLGFTSLSTIDALVNATKSSAGRSLLYNFFEIIRTNPIFLPLLCSVAQRKMMKSKEAFRLARWLALKMFMCHLICIAGEYEPEYANVVGNEPIPTWPVNSPKRWSVLLDAVIVNDTITVPTTDVIGAPNNKAVVLMDSGASYTYAPTNICEAIYGNVTGASYDSTINQWVVPCDAEINMALQIGGQVFPIHPLDLTPTGLTDNSTCYGSFIPQSVPIGNGQFDWLIGDNFLRSVYSVYDFGDFDESGKMGNPYMKLLSIVDPDEASIDFHNARGGTPRTNITFTGLNGISVAPSFSISNDISSSLERIGKYLPIMLGIVALNALVLIVLAIAGLVMCCRRLRKRKNTGLRTRTPLGRTSPMPMNPRSTYVAGYGRPDTHVYEPVSMALTEDTFVPPSPAFHADGGSRPGDRPKSVA